MRSPICAASSRVGVRISPRTCVARTAERCWSMGRKKAAVLPVPVCAHARTSRRARASGTTSDWTGEGSAYSSSATARTSAGASPSAAKGAVAGVDDGGGAPPARGTGRLAVVTKAAPRSPPQANTQLSHPKLSLGGLAALLLLLRQLLEDDVHAACGG